MAQAHEGRPRILMQNPGGGNDHSRVKGMSLERKLPLLMTTVLLLLLTAAVFLTYREVSRASEVVTVDRMRDFTDGLANSTSAGVPRAATQFRVVAENPAVARVIADRTPSESDLTSVRAALATLAAAADSGVSTELWSADGRIVAALGEPRTDNTRPDLANAVTGPDSLSIGSFYTLDGRVHYWTTRPVTGSDGSQGLIAQRRRLNSQPAVERDIARIAGQEVTMLFRNTDGSVWTTLGGRAVDPPQNRRTVRGMLTFSHPDVVAGGPVIAYERAVERTPWTIVLELPYTELSEGPRQMLGNFAIVSLLLLLVGATALWLISRRITLPLKRLTLASEGIARGDYTQRVDAKGDYEIARLGESFNRMAGEIAEVHRELQASAGAAAAAKEAAEAANSSKSNFLAAMSHELRTPLNAIAGYVDLLELGLRGPLTDEQRIDLTRIKRSQQYLLGLIEEILVFSQIDAQQIVFSISEVPIESIIRDAEAMLDPQIRAKGIRYTCRTCDPGLLVLADRDRTQQVLINLLVNAAKYTDVGGSITISCETAGNRVLVKVADTGVGIPEEKLGRIFDAFVQLDRSLNQPREGVGLGLTIARDLARAMGGDLHVESVLGSGSTFTLELPAAVDGSEESGGGQPEREAVATR